MGKKTFTISLLVAVGYGLCAFWQKKIVDFSGTPTYLIALAFTQIVLALFLKGLFPKEKFWPDFSRGALVFLGLLCFNLGTIAYFLALENSLASLVVPLSNLSLLVTVFLSAYFLKEKVGKWQWWGGVFVVLGLIFLGWGGDF